jgi:hypothetical protein
MKIVIEEKEDYVDLDIISEDYYVSKRFDKDKEDKKELVEYLALALTEAFKNK